MSFIDTTKMQLAAAQDNIELGQFSRDIEPEAGQRDYVEVDAKATKAALHQPVESGADRFEAVQVIRGKYKRYLIMLGRCSQRFGTSILTYLQISDNDDYLVRSAYNIKMPYSLLPVK
jgi:hypothetical protein